MSEQPRRECAELYCHNPPTTTIHGVEVCERHKAEIELPWTTLNNQQAEIKWLQDLNRLHLSDIARLHKRLAELEAIVAKLISGVRSDDVYSDNWCPVCHCHPYEHEHNECPVGSVEYWVDGVAYDTRETAKAGKTEGE